MDLPALKAGGPYKLTIAGKNRVEVNNVLVGEVWIASGQSNMQWPLNQTVGGEDAVKNSTDPKLHLLYIPLHTSQTPEDNITPPWQESKPDSSSNFSAVAYHFGKELRKRLGIPVGIIHTSWGGTYAEAWTRRGVIESTPGLKCTCPAIWPEAELPDGAAELFNQQAQYLRRWRRPAPPASSRLPRPSPRAIPRTRAIPTSLPSSTTP